MTSEKIDLITLARGAWHRSVSYRNKV